MKRRDYVVVAPPLTTWSSRKAGEDCTPSEAV
jgi:hypothetical protein